MTYAILAIERKVLPAGHEDVAVSLGSLADLQIVRATTFRPRRRPVAKPSRFSRNATATRIGR